ncbi:SDH family Clp fold serine proteinase [Burkholderia multivorans]|uniref:SDH family Clp fold serine proteinase n=1 Tax=Burkholderia multivorans TaxID=87883 RepID=UPI000CFF0FA1|nr:hypothetical protein [Burkholderia multivorans]MBU9403884.1 hypothetical protein [Burkholderia multivorans]MDN8046170.1 hypothetical protein [Burkholderia multivorans]PRH28260.1 hypothetical protein C6T71_07420 [Burkholderia multivorans]
MPDYFPRTKDLPAQSPLFWVSHKDRYLRQQLIRDIEEQTGRDLVVYFTDCDRSAATIDPTDDTYLAELLLNREREPVDLLLETNGGLTDATEKICALLRKTAPDLRVIVPRRAKSNGTVVALCGQSVVMSVTSELGPIDPSVGGVPVDFILKSPPAAINPIQLQIAQTALEQTKKLAKQLLSTGMMKGRADAEIDGTIAKLASRDHFHSHGSVMDCTEAAALGLNVEELDVKSDLWKRIWLLRTMYSYDCGQSGHSKLFESHKLSTAVTQPKPATPGLVGP